MFTINEWVGIQAQYEAEERYWAAYLRGVVRRLAGVIIGRAHQLPSLPASATQSAPTLEASRVLRTVAIDAIRGSAVGAQGYDDRFYPRNPADESRWQQIAAALIRGEVLPPVELIQVGMIFYVRDGHRRVSTARALGQTQIDALIVATAELPLNEATAPRAGGIPGAAPAARREYPGRSA